MSNSVVFIEYFWAIYCLIKSVSWDDNRPNNKLVINIVLLVLGIILLVLAVVGYSPIH